MDNVRYNRIKAANKREQNDTRISYAKREQARPLVRAVLAEQDKTGTWLSEQMAGNVFVKPNGQNEARFSYAMARKRRTKSNLGTVSRWMTNKIQPSVEQLFDIAKHLDVDGKEKEYSDYK